MRFAILLALAPLAAAQPPRPTEYEKGLQLAEKREHAKAVDAFTAALKADPTMAAAHDARGDAYLKLGKFPEAIADFDQYLEANPKQEPEHWRRGIAYYFAERYQDGVKQFETHKTVNPEDVENAVWHYLCNAKVVGKEKAEKELIAVTADRRVPMAEVQKLFAGQFKPADVLAAADKLDAKTLAGKEARFYANLYVALWYEAAGENKKVIEYLTPAVEKYEISHYMWDVAKAHLAVAKARK